MTVIITYEFPRLPYKMKVALSLAILEVMYSPVPVISDTMYKYLLQK